MHKHLTGRLVFEIVSHSTLSAADVTAKSGRFICPNLPTNTHDTPL